LVNVETQMRKATCVPVESAVGLLWREYVCG
jgi:hypothetical protein